MRWCIRRQKTARVTLSAVGLPRRQGPSPLRQGRFSGNFRELESTLQAAVHRARLQGNDTILPEHLTVGGIGEDE